ncbi:MFS transporter [Geobacter metallireducens]|uniref:MFS transporter n=1 Tax=Geobacter metallireducens TaxID=28232 RepID=UPI001930AC34
MKGNQHGRLDNGRGPLRHAVFRCLWIASLVSNLGTWMQNVAGVWVHDHGDSIGDAGGAHADGSPSRAAHGAWKQADGL